VRYSDTTALLVDGMRQQRPLAAVAGAATAAQTILYELFVTAALCYATRLSADGAVWFTTALHRYYFDDMQLLTSHCQHHCSQRSTAVAIAPYCYAQ
jgi:hypothetical protein